MAKGRFSLIMFSIILIVFLMTLAVAQSAKIDVKTIKETYLADEKITVRISLLDENNNPLNKPVNIIIEDAEKTKKLEYTIDSNQFEEISLGENAPSGFWVISATYQGIEAKTDFLIQANEEVEFKIIGDELIITNIGNTRYEREVQIIIEDVAVIKRPSLDIGESVSYRLIAPNGTYDVRVTDGKNMLIQVGVALTGDVVGVLDARVSQRTPITGIGPEALEGSSYSFFRQSPVVYIFIFIVIGALILLTIERHYRKKAEER